MDAASTSEGGSGRAFWPVLVAAALIVVIAGLGVWQLQRLSEKQALIRFYELQTRGSVQALPVALDAADAAELAGWAFRRVTVSGQFFHDAEMLVQPRTRRGQSGAEVITPLLRDEGVPVLVNRGWVPQSREDPETRPESLPEGRGRIEGLVRPALPPSAFTPENDPANDVWFYTDPLAMAAHVGLGETAPLTVWAIGTTVSGVLPPGELPHPWSVDLTFPNNHLQYAITWFSLAGALVVMLVVWVRRQSTPGEAEDKKEVLMPAYAELETRFKRLSHLTGIANVLHWDMSTFMPSGGAGTRGEQLATLAALSHQQLVDPAVGELLEAAEQKARLGEWQRANLREMRRQWVHATAVPADLVEARAWAHAACGMAWRRARADDDFSLVREHLERVVAIERQVGQAKAEVLECSPYEALVDVFEPAMRANRIDATFGQLEAFLPEFLGRVLERQSRESPVLYPDGPFSEEAQLKLARSLMELLGFDFEHGRLDVSLHPFCVGTPQDVRITTRFNENDFSESVMAVLHETGHALYERALPAEWRCQPVGQACGMGLHESQALLVEMQASRSRVFLAFAANLMREQLNGAGEAWSLGNLIRLYTRVTPGLIRVEADEVTYQAHVILRYRLERALIEGRLKVSELPDAWATETKRFLGLAPASDREGCLQDIHWYEGAFGYFPSYTLGAIMAAQLFEAATSNRPDILPGIGRGDFKPLTEWLRTHVHERGSLLSTDDLLVQITGRPLDVESFTSHLKQRYLP